MFINPVITQEERTKRQVIELNNMVNRAMDICGSLTKKMFDLFWNNPEATPMQMSEMYGPQAYALFVKLATWQTVLQQISPDYVPINVPEKYAYQINADGTVTITEIPPVVEEPDPVEGPVEPPVEPPVVEEPVPVEG
jgi:hypothetical protein